MIWNKQERIKFRVYSKPNQLIKYDNNGSCHTKHCLKAIPWGLMGRMAKLTSKTETNKGKKLNLLYPAHAEALRKAELVANKFPTLEEMKREIKAKTLTKISPEKASQLKQRQIFCIGAYDTWRGKYDIHVPINRLQKKYNLQWLRTLMSYHRFTNLTEVFSGDLNSKLNKNIRSKDFEAIPCNCNSSSKVNGKCVFKGECRRIMVIYKVLCKEIGKFYIRNTQQKVKKRIESHMRNVCNLANRKQQSDSFASHFVTVFQVRDSTKLTRKDVHKCISVDILWEGNPITIMKSFGKPSCALYI